MATKNGQQKAVQSNLNGFFGAGGVTRTRDLLITSEMLYRLSYTSILLYLLSDQLLCNNTAHLVNKYARMNVQFIRALYGGEGGI